MVKQKISLNNYYRNYHIHSEFGKRSDIINNKIFKQDFEELNINLVDHQTISSFFIENEKWCTSLKKFIYKWASNFSYFVRLKYINEDSNLDEKYNKPKKKEKLSDFPILKSISASSKSIVPGYGK